MASDYVTQKQLLAHMNIIMKHVPVYNRHDVFMCTSLHHQHQNSKVTNRFQIFVNTAALPCKDYC